MLVCFVLLCPSDNLGACCRARVSCLRSRIALCSLLTVFRNGWPTTKVEYHSGVFKIVPGGLVFF